MDDLDDLIASIIGDAGGTEDAAELEGLGGAVELDALFDDGVVNQRYERPRLNPFVHVDYEHAEEFARDFEFKRGMRVFAFVSGNFIFGDFLEALVDLEKIDIKRLGIQTLSMSQDNIDSLSNILDMCDVEELSLVLSDYWYAHERGELVPYLYEQLDIGDGFECAYASIHTKITTIETQAGNKLVIHGSANMRSSRNIEYFCIEQDDGLYDFVYQYQKRIIDAYNVVNKDAKRKKSVRGGKLWQAVAQEAAAVAARQ